MRSTSLNLRGVLGAAALLLSATGVVSADGAAGDEKPATDLVDALRPTGLGCTLESIRVRPFGWVEASVSTTPGLQASERSGRVFDVEKDGFRLHQAYFAVERTPAEDRSFDLGGKVALLWGTDARFVHAQGLGDEQTGEEQFDLLEAKLLARFAVAHGLTVSLGKCTTPLGFEVIEAPNNLLVSRSFLFGYAIPFTHTGMIVSLGVSAQVKVSYGIVKGWDVVEDPNDAWTQLVGIAWTSPSKEDSITANAILGAERPDNDRDLRGVVDATWTHSFCGGLWTTTLNADFGFEQGAAPDGGDATWGGVAGYLTEKVCDGVLTTIRAEWFRDADGTRLGEPATLGDLVYGLDWTPFRRLPNLRVRPEARWDHSFDGKFFDDGRAHDQFSLTLDVLFTF